MLLLDLIRIELAAGDGDWEMERREGMENCFEFIPSHTQNCTKQKIQNHQSAFASKIPNRFSTHY
jgi:hypothetical protein